MQQGHFFVAKSSLKNIECLMYLRDLKQFRCIFWSLKIV